MFSAHQEKLGSNREQIWKHRWGWINRDSVTENKENPERKIFKEKREKWSVKTTEKKIFERIKGNFNCWRWRQGSVRLEGTKSKENDSKTYDRCWANKGRKMNVKRNDRSFACRPWLSRWGFWGDYRVVPVLFYPFFVDFVFLSRIDLRPDSSTASQARLDPQGSKQWKWTLSSQRPAIDHLLLIKF